MMEEQKRKDRKHGHGGDEERERIRRTDASLIKQIEDSQMAFKGDFEKLDDEIKVQLKALKDDDIETVRRIHA